jgi:hypothetical protein
VIRNDEHWLSLVDSLHSAAIGERGLNAALEGPGRRHRLQEVPDSERKPSILGASSAVELEVVFRQQLQNAGVRLMDRAASIRFTQAQRDRSGVDPKLIEADAVLGKSDVLLEAVTVFDERAPLGAGFKVTATDVKTGASLVTFYTPAMPHLAPAAPYYQATSSGFERGQPQITPSVPDIGAALARALMQVLGRGWRQDSGRVSISWGYAPRTGTWAECKPHGFKCKPLQLATLQAPGH